MSDDYNRVLGRLKEERERMSLSQREMCQHVGMSQGQYCKIENGEQHFSFDEVKPQGKVSEHFFPLLSCIFSLPKAVTNVIL